MTYDMVRINIVIMTRWSMEVDMTVIDKRLALKNNRDVDYISFGKGKKDLIIIPGLSDGINTIKGKGRLLSWYYRQYKKDYKVHVFSRMNQLKKNSTTKDMADDLVEAMDVLKIDKAFVYGVSQGGMIAQHLAISHGDRVEKLVLAITTSKANKTLKHVVRSWIEMAENNDYKKLMQDTMIKTFTKQKLKTYRLMMPFVGMFGKPKSFERFYIQAKACLTHDAHDKLSTIKCPVLIIGGDSDKVVGVNTCEEIASQIEGADLVLYPGQGHGAYEEIKEFDDVVRKFLKD